jgi:hypothetical protein
VSFLLSSLQFSLFRTPQSEILHSVFDELMLLTCTRTPADVGPANPHHTGVDDSENRGCILTPPTTQWQCDAGANPTQGFSLTSNGTLEYNNSTTFFACPTGDNGGWNIYSTPLMGQVCSPIWLHADNTCQAPAPSSSPAPSAAPSASPAPSSGCPLDLTGDWEVRIC